MNYFVEIQKLQVKYGNNPATEKCLSESLNLFSAFSQDVIDKLKEKAQNSPAKAVSR